MKCCAPMTFRVALTALLAVFSCEVRAAAPDADNEEAETTSEPAPATRAAARVAPEEASPDVGRYVGLAPPAPPLRIENESATIRFGLLAQPQLEAVGAPDATSTT